MPGTGPRDLTSIASGVSAGKIQVYRIGPIVTLSIENVAFTGQASGWGSVVVLPPEFRPPVDLRQNLIGAGNDAQLAVYRTGGLAMNRTSGTTYRYVLTWSTDAVWS